MIKFAQWVDNSSLYLLHVLCLMCSYFDHRTAACSSWLRSKNPSKQCEGKNYMFVCGVLPPVAVVWAWGRGASSVKWNPCVCVSMCLWLRDPSPLSMKHATRNILCTVQCTQPISHSATPSPTSTAPGCVHTWPHLHTQTNTNMYSHTLASIHNALSHFPPHQHTPYSRSN